MTPLEAVFIATRLHGLQVDKCGDPYIAHCVRVMMRLPADASDEEKIAALLHDVIEDVPDGYERLIEEGVPELAIAIVAQLSRRTGEAYDEYIQRVAAGLGHRIKVADLEDNTDPARLARLPSVVSERLRKKYSHALALLRAWAKERGVDMGETA